MQTHSGKPVIVAIGLHVYGTGFTRVYLSLFSWLSKYYDIHWLGIGYFGSAVKTNHYTLYPNNINGGDIYGAYKAAELAQNLKTSFILVLNDLYMFKNYKRQLEPLKNKGIKLVAYIPLDGYIVNTTVAEDILFLDTVVFYTKWAKNEVQKSLQKLGHTKMPTFKTIYHGVDVASFTSVQKKEHLQLKQSIFYKINNIADAVFILNANRASERKNLEATLLAFKQSIPHFTKPAYLCLHHPGAASKEKEMLKNRVEELGILDWVIFNPLGNDYVNDETLAMLYQSCAIGINSCFGEGWGMIAFEHAACGAAQIVPNHSTPGEIWLDAALLIDKEEQVLLNSNPSVMYKVSENHLSKHLIELVNDTQVLEQVADNCKRLANECMFSWELIANEWRSVLC